MNPAEEHNSLNTMGIEPRSVIDGYLMADSPEPTTVKESMTVQGNENRRIAEARQADAEELAGLERIVKQLEQKKEKR